MEAEASDLLESVAGVRDDICGHPRGGHRVRASVDGVSDVRHWRWNVNNGELALFFRKILWDVLEPWDLPRWCTCLTRPVTHRLLIGAVPKGVDPTSELRTRLRPWRTDWRNFSRDGSNKDGALSSLEMVTPQVITLTVARSGRNVLRGGCPEHSDWWTQGRC